MYESNDKGEVFNKGVGFKVWMGNTIRFRFDYCVGKGICVVYTIGCLEVHVTKQYMISPNYARI